MSILPVKFVSIYFSNVNTVFSYLFSIETVQNIFLGIQRILNSMAIVCFYSDISNVVVVKYFSHLFGEILFFF